MPLSSRTKLGPYQIQSSLGAGGMGEVYRARDTRLGRDVAIKALPEALANDADRLRRFEQEARTIAALNHANILGIHDIGAHDGAPFLASEFLEGQTVREKLESGPLPVRRASEYALGIGQGLAAAHEKGVVHRDLKPENVFVTRNGRVKVLDFGLAKLVRPEESHETVVTLTNPATLPGMVMGTVGYMSPERVRGEPSDARSDIFSFSAVLYEMLTSKRAFKRETSAETMTPILREEPPELNDTGWQGPLALQRILVRCLEKNVERRFQSASDLAFAIESLSGTSTAKSVPQPKSRQAWPRWAATALGVLVLGAAAWWVGRWSSARPQPKYTRLTYQQGYLSNARFAKHGQTVVYSARWNNDPLQVYSVRTEFPQSTKVDLPSAALLALSSSGDMELAVDRVHESWFMYGTMAQAQMAGGTPRAQEKDVIAADYAPDGRTLAVVRQANPKVQLEFPALFPKQTGITVLRSQSKMRIALSDPGPSDSRSYFRRGRK
jgi:serine/threonine protein kinase